LTPVKDRLPRFLIAAKNRSLASISHLAGVRIPYHNHNLTERRGAQISVNVRGDGPWSDRTSEKAAERAISWTSFRTLSRCPGWPPLRQRRGDYREILHPNNNPAIRATNGMVFGIG
jgi:hypothetical protein